MELRRSANRMDSRLRGSDGSAECGVNKEPAIWYIAKQTPVADTQVTSIRFAIDILFEYCILGVG